MGEGAYLREKERERRRIHRRTGRLAERRTASPERMRGGGEEHVEGV